MHSALPTDPAKEAADLLSLAGWYRAWAELASSEREKAQRISFAISLEKRARAMLKPAIATAENSEAAGARRMDRTAVAQDVAGGLV
jgi:hypothetical protein